jgi:hypothetical protein
MKINEKFKPSYDSRINAFLIMGTNKPVKITDAQSGLIRRLIDVHPTGNKLPPTKYHALVARLEFELGAIANHCLEVYRRLGKNYYSNYQPLEMMYKTNAFFNFIEAHYEQFDQQGGVSAKQAWNLYKTWCDDAKIVHPMQMYTFRSELGQYFEKFHDRITIDGVLVRSYYETLKADLYKTPVDDDPTTFKLVLNETISLLDLDLAEWPAQYSKADGSPSKYWDDGERTIGGKIQRPRPSQIVDTYLRDLDTSQEHYVKVPYDHVVIDFDLRGDDGEKSVERSLEAAALWPATYAELSRSGNGVHLHYRYDGDIERLDANYSDGIEVKRYPGNSALRRRLVRCNDVPVATISSGLPLKENKPVLAPGVMKSDRALRKLIHENLRKEHHPGTKPSIDFIHHILEEAYESGMQYDVTDLQQKIITFANNSSNRSIECLRVVSNMRWKQTSAEEDEAEVMVTPKDDRIALFDVEVYPNLFVICWKFKSPPGEKPSPDQVTRLINPKPHEVQALLELKLVGFNNRSYDNHIMWAAALGYSNAQLYQMSKKIIANVVGVKFGEAYGVSYTDVYDFSTNKQGLKKWQIQLGLEHREMDIPWDQPVPNKRILDVVNYCANDVVSLEEVLNHLDGDYKARLILSDLSGLSPNHTTANHTAAIVFGRDKNPQSSFKYTDLRKEFPGYDFVIETGKPVRSEYRGEVVGEGGYVYAEPGIYNDVVLLDIASMHPTSIGELNLFGDHTPRFMALVEAQLALKRRDYAACKHLLDGKFTPYIEEIEELQKTNPEAAKKAAGDLRYGLKIAINIVYGLTSAKFNNPFRDFRNVDNIVAKRGALFMVNLKGYIQDILKLKVVHIKTDSVKIPGATSEDIRKITDFGAKYGYTFEHEATYEKFGLVNDAVYVAKDEKGWTATGKQYSEEYSSYVYKKLFGQEERIVFNDLCETRHVQQGALYLDFGAHGDIPAVDAADSMGFVETALAEIKIAEKQVKVTEKYGNDSEKSLAEAELVIAREGYNVALEKLIFVGKTGRFTPVKPGFGGGHLYRIKDGKHYAVQGTKGRLWVDSSIANDLPGDAIDYDYFEDLVEEARANLDRFLVGSNFTDIADFLS